MRYFCELWEVCRQSSLSIRAVADGLMAGIRHWPASFRTWALFVLMPGHAGHDFAPEPTASELTHTPSRPASLRAWALSYDQGLATSLQFAVRGDAGTDEILQDPLMYQEAVFPGLLLSRVPAGCRDGVAQTGRTIVQLAARIGQQPEAWQCYSARPAATPIADTAGCADRPNDGESLSLSSP